MIKINSSLLATMRNTAESLMTDTCTIEAGADAVGDMGEVLSDVYTAVASSVACRVITIGNRFKETVGITAERETITDAYRLIVPYGTALAVDQRITLDSDSSRWQVVDLLTERTSETDAQAVIVRING